MVFKRIKQPDNYTCSAASAAMLTGTSVESFIKYVGFKGKPTKKRPSGGHYFDEILAYCKKHGWHQVPHIYENNQPKYKPFDFPCFVFVKFQSNHHCVFFDGIGVIDPLDPIPYKKIEDYDIHWVIPMAQIYREY